MIKEAKIDMGPNETRIIFLDKNYPPNGGILSATQIIDQCVDWDIPYCKLYLVPEIKNDNIPNLPFSYEFIA